MQPKTNRRFVIRKVGSQPPQYFQTKGQRKVREKRQVEDVTIDRVRGFWSNSRGKARIYTDNTRTLPTDCQFVERVKSQPSPSLSLVRRWW